MKHPSPRSLILALAAFAAGAFAPAHALTVVDNFASVTEDGTLLSSVSGWSHVAGTDNLNNAAVSAAAGYGPSNGARVTAREGYGLALNGGNILTAADGALEFKFNFKGSSSGDNYQQAQIMIGQSGGVKGLVVEFNGGTSNNSTDNYIRVSSGTGTTWGSPGLATVANSAWVTGKWYEVTINFSLLTTGTGQSVTGSLSVYDLTSESWLLQNISIAGTGNTTGAFNTANIVQLKNVGTARAFDVSDLRLGLATVPEPTTAASLAGLLALGAVAARRRRAVQAGRQ